MSSLQSRPIISRLFFALALFLVTATHASAQARLYTCSSENGFFGAIYAPGWDYISGYGSQADCANACWGFNNCEAHYCTTIGYCVALHAGASSSSGGSGGSGGGAVGPSQSNLPFGAACGFNSECRSGECWLGFCQ